MNDKYIFPNDLWSNFKACSYFKLFISKSLKGNINFVIIDSISINNNECSFGVFDKKKNADELEELIMSNITSYTSSCKIYNGTNFIVSVVPSNKIDPKEQINKGISAFDLGNCTNELKEFYNISREENLIILNIETKNDNNQNEEDNKSFKLGKNTNLEIYDYSGQKLNLSLCKDNIKIIKYIGDIKELDLDSAKTFSEKGIDVFDASDKFFNDICHPYNNPYGKDIIINDRRNEIYQNVSFCQDGCTYNGINYDLKAANCLCNSNSFQREENNITYNNKEPEIINFDTLTKSFIENLLNFNFEVVKCYKLILNKKNYIHNIGFLCLSSMFILQFILFIIYLIKKINPIKYFLLIFKIKNHNINNTKKYHNKMNNNKNRFKKLKKSIKKNKVNPPPKDTIFGKKSINDNIAKSKLNKNIYNNYQDNKICYEDNINNKIEQQPKDKKKK